MEFYKLKINNGYIEIDFIDGTYVHVSLVYFRDTIYATDELIRIINKYGDFRESSFDWPNMVWDPIADTWRYVTNISAKGLKEFNEKQDLLIFIQQCRSNLLNKNVV